MSPTEFKNPHAQSCSLLAKTIQLLTSCGKSPAVIAEESGLPFYWVQSLRYNHKIDPSVTKTVALYEHLSGKKLEL